MKCSVGKSNAISSDFDRDSISNNSGYTHSLWMEVRLPSFPHLDANVAADVCIVGAGIVGLTCAYTATH